MPLGFDPDFLPAKNNKANALANLGNFKDAILLCDKVLEENPNYLLLEKILRFYYLQILILTEPVLYPMLKIHLIRNPPFLKMPLF